MTPATMIAHFGISYESFATEITVVILSTTIFPFQMTVKMGFVVGLVVAKLAAKLGCRTVINIDVK